MTIERTRILGPEFAPLADDTEESIVGSSLHQGAMVGLHDSLDACGRGRGLPWFVGNQIRLLVPRVGGRLLTLSPDLLIHPTLSSGSRDSIIVAADGPPALVIEIASPSTARARDLAEGTPRGKPAAYAALGIAEYLVFDPVGDDVPDRLWARRLGPDGYMPWGPDADGRWHSALGISFFPDDAFLRVHDQDGQLVLTGAELRERNRQLEAELRRLRGE